MKVGICPFRGRIYEGLVGVLLVLGIRGVDGVSAGVLVIKGLGITKRKISIFLSRAQRNLTQPILVSIFIVAMRSPFKSIMSFSVCLLRR